MIRSKGVVIATFVKRMESVLNQNGMSINQKRSFKINLAKYFGILQYRKTIF